ncbi:MAG: 5-formyltetrahydrofolate cyclo-ligase [Alphaproteobacteria bacterium]
MDIAEAKRALRKTASASREAAAAACGVLAGTDVARNCMASFPPRPDDVVSAYWPVGAELDPRPLLEALARRGQRLALPVVQGRGRALLFRRWQWGDPLVRGSLGIPTPAPEAESIRPSVLLVPLLAFDRAGYRLGHGAGYYDMTLAALRADGGPCAAIGLAFSAQEVPSVPHDERDEPLDGIVTERTAMRAVGPGAP